jgi:hypothetical protein
VNYHKHATGTQHTRDEHAADTDERVSTANHAQGRPDAERRNGLQPRVGIVDGTMALLVGGTLRYRGLRESPQ